MRKRIGSFVLGTILGVAVPAASARESTYPELLASMVDLQSLATLPAPGAKCILLSSYDRSSRTEDDKERDVDADRQRS